MLCYVMLCYVMLCYVMYVCMYVCMYTCMYKYYKHKCQYIYVYNINLSHNEPTHKNWQLIRIFLVSKRLSSPFAPKKTAVLGGHVTRTLRLPPR